jgi:hypothetical protein
MMPIHWVTSHRHAQQISLEQQEELVRVDLLQIGSKHLRWNYCVAAIFVFNDVATHPGVSASSLGCSPWRRWR